MQHSLNGRTLTYQERLKNALRFKIFCLVYMKRILNKTVMEKCFHTIKQAA